MLTNIIKSESEPLLPAGPHLSMFDLDYLALMGW